jgi:undecaprenyl-diphosphatase
MPPLDWIQAVVYGVIQGLTEFLPISSSGHLYLFPALLKLKDAGAGFTAVIQLGTLAAVLIYFRIDLGRLIGAWFRSLGDAEVRKTEEARQAWGVFWGTLPIIAVGLLLKDLIEGGFRSPWVVGVSLIFFGLLMGVAEKIGPQKKGLDRVTRRDGVVMGLFQCLALIPGSSRSGSTITGGLFMGLDRAAAARYSFLLSVPSVLASGLYKLVDERDALLAEGLAPTIIATVVSFIVGYAAIAWLMQFLQTKSLWVFVWYRVALGLAVLGLAASGFFVAGGG